MNDDLLGYALVTAVVIIPALGITARFAVKPVVDAIVRLKETFATAPSTLIEQRLLELETELHATRQEVQQLKEVEAFYRALSPESHLAQVPPNGSVTPERTTNSLPSELA